MNIHKFHSQKPVESNKKILIGIISIAISVSAGFISNDSSSPHYENLKVLPKNISSKELQSIMVDDFEDGLGVTCGFCHAPKKDGHGLDFASDAKPEKEIARSMMRMTIGINQKYFKLKHPQIGNSELTVTCNTCHKGVAFPDGSN
jgi:hypothetical protein